MNKENVRKFALCIGTKVESVSSAGWASCKCPLAPWTHDSGKDGNPSFAIKIEESGESTFNCYTCKSGDLLQLVQLLKGFGAKAPKYKLADAVALVMAEDEADQNVVVVKDYEEVEATTTFHPFKESWVYSFMPAKKSPAAMKYLSTRQISPAIIEALNLRFDTSKKTVCFPYRDFKNRLAGFRGRYINPAPGTSSYHMYKSHEGGYNPQVWYGEEWVDLDRPVVMVESVFDLASVARVYDNVVAPLTVGMSMEKVKRMANALEIITLFDNGVGGDKARKLIDKYLPKSSRVHLLPENAKDPGEMNELQVIAQLSAHIPAAAMKPLA